MHDIFQTKKIMDAFALRTGLIGQSGPIRRYLWTDAFAVCNFLELYQQTKDHSYLVSALQLIDQVHQILGRHRDDDTRPGWISGLDERAGERHPTLGGLRIGKDLNERKQHEPFDEQMEWNCDGQYFHYLTKWMQALDCTTRSTGNSVYTRWALELARTAHDKFTYISQDDSQMRMFWKMSIDLSYPLVLSMGQHDPLDGLISYLQLNSTLSERKDLSEDPGLDKEISAMSDLCANQRWLTTDSLGLGGLLTDACKLLQLNLYQGNHELKLLRLILDDSSQGLEALSMMHPFEQPVSSRLAFRELGLSIGLHAIERMKDLVDQYPAFMADHRSIVSQIERLTKYFPLISTIEQCWMNPDNRNSDLWIEHQNINSVMLVTSLLPNTFLLLK